MDGAKGLRKAVDKVFGKKAAVQRVESSIRPAGAQKIFGGAVDHGLRPPAAGFTRGHGQTPLRGGTCLA
jgi:hypothetical protein